MASQVLSKQLLHFEAAAQHLNFTNAAKALKQSQPAISHSIRTLEKELETPLFKRLHRGVELTQEGQLLFEAVTNSIDAIEQILKDIQADSNKNNIVTLSLSTATATYGILPKIGDFKKKHPDIMLHYITHDTDERLGKEDADLTIPLGFHTESKDFDSWQLTEEVIFPVCSPSYLKTNNLTASDINLNTLASLALIHLEERYESRMTWQRWFASFDIKNKAINSGTRFNDYSVVIQTALEGQGVMLGWQHIVQPLVEQNRLVRLGTNVIQTEKAFYALTSNKKELSTSATVFKNWLMDKAF